MLLSDGILLIMVMECEYDVWLWKEGKSFKWVYNLVQS